MEGLKLEVGKTYEVRKPYEVKAITKQNTIIKITEVICDGVYMGDNGYAYNSDGTTYSDYHPRFDLVKEMTP